jgi:hypothetical protein
MLGKYPGNAEFSCIFAGTWPQERLVHAGSLLFCVPGKSKRDTSDKGKKNAT